MKRITLAQMEKNRRAATYAQLCQYVCAQIEAGHLKPLKASGLNGKKPALYNEYWIVEPEPDYGVYEEELKYRTSPKISLDYYIKHLAQYEADRMWVRRFNDYLETHPFPPEQEISLNERSFEIWGREKFLRQEQGKKILKRCGVGTESLRVYDTCEPLAYYSHHRRTPQNILILENKDTFYSMRRCLMEKDSPIFHVPFGTLVYGAGKGILRSFQDYAFCVEPYMREAGNKIYYFGDLDYEGVAIYEQLSEAFLKDNGQQIAPFREAYIRMLKKAEEKEKLPEMKAGQNRGKMAVFLSYFAPDDADAMEQILADGRYIPQEILNISDFVT